MDLTRHVLTATDTGKPSLRPATFLQKRMLLHHTKKPRLQVYRRIENFIRTKYESKRWVMDGPMPDPSTLAEGDDLTVGLALFLYTYNLTISLLPP